MSLRPRVALFLLAAVLGALPVPGGWPRALRAQSLLIRPPNLTGAWVAPRGVVQFNLIHRFDVSPAPARKVTNSPTLLVAYGPGADLMLGFNYASSSDLVANYPNEWEFFGRWLPWRQDSGGMLDVGLQGGYNLATESLDGEVSVARALGRARLFAAARALGNDPATDDTRYAVAGGGVLTLTDGISVSGDLGGVLDREDDEELAWGVGAQLGVPYTPHTLSIHVTNVNTGTLAGTSRGSGTTRFGFEYTIPITLRRYARSGDSGGEDGAVMGRPGDGMGGNTASMGQMPASDTVEVEVQGLAYGTPVLEVAVGTTVRWVNRDPVQHTVTSDQDLFESGLIDPNESWSHTFGEAGEYPYHCTPHPFMTGRVVVQGRQDR